VGIGAAFNPCTTPTGLSASGITNTDANVNWAAVSGAVSYDVDYKATTTTTWTNAATATTATTVAITGLTAGTAYDWRVRTNCTAGSGNYAQAQFTTTGGSPCITAFEPNETLATAAAISSGVTNSAAISTSTDIDYYKITTTATSNIVYNLVGPAGVDYDLYIYNSAGTQIGSSLGSTATETVTLNNQAAGTYYIKVIGYLGANSATCYTIKATATTVTSCQSALDVSTNGTIAGAATIPFNTNVTGLISPVGDNDYYKFVITTGGTATVTLTTLPGDYDLTVVNSAGTQLAISQNGGTTSETISRTYTPGTYYARVYGFNNANNASVCYTLKVQLGTATLNGNEPVMVNKGVIKTYPNPVTNMLNVSVLGEVNGKGIIQIVDQNGVVVLEQKNTSNPQMINVAHLPKGIYLLRLNNGDSNMSSKFVKE
jgi:Secretion system C-terminal sorting domain/Fibronectin type III domain/Bacterial pre-peptidase C-terminal domain